MSDLSKADMSVLQARLNSVNVDGTSMDPIRASYLIQYRKSLIGRHFKSIAQIVSFTLHGLVSDEVLDMWVSAGHMTSLLWTPVIDDMNNYCVSLCHFIH